MEKYNLPNDLKVFGIQVKTFPQGISEAFDDLVKKVGGFNRSFYGISYLKNGSMVYLATVVEKTEGEAAKFKAERCTIEKGEYLVTTIYDWRKKTDTIKDVFGEMLKDKRADHTKPAIEWYKDESEMVCMIKMKVNN